MHLENNGVQKYTGKVKTNMLLYVATLIFTL